MIWYTVTLNNFVSSGHHKITLQWGHPIWIYYLDISECSLLLYPCALLKNIYIIFGKMFLHFDIVIRAFQKASGTSLTLIQTNQIRCSVWQEVGLKG